MSAFSRVLVLLAVLLAGAPALADTGLPTGDAAYKAFPAAKPGEARDYFIGPLDTIEVTVFQEPDLSVKEVQVDANGNILLPLIGSINAGNKTTSQLAHEIAAGYNAKYLHDPQVTVRVIKALSQQVTVEGSVTEPGVYPLTGKTSLVDAIAMARGPTRVARLSEIAIFREVNGQRVGAVFDLNKIRKGQEPDPEILGRDRVVVGLALGKAAWRDFLQATGSLGMFRPF